MQILTAGKDSSLPMPVLVSLCGVVVGCIFLARCSHRKTKKKASKIHDLPTSSSILGDLGEVTANAHRFLDWVSDTCVHFHGEPWRLRILGQKDTVIFCTPEAAEDIMVKQFDNFPHGESMNARLRQLLGHSILTTDGEQWRHQRKTAVKFFTGKTLRLCMLQTMQKNVQQLYEAFDQSIADGEPVDMINLFLQFTLQTFTEIGLGVDLQWIGKKEPHPFDEFVSIGSSTTARRFRVPNFLWQLKRWLGVGDEGQFFRATETTRKWFQTLVEESLEATARRQQKRFSKANQGGDEDHDTTTIKSVVELFMEFSEHDKAGLRQEDLVDFLLAFVLAAQDTTALTLTWMFYALSKHPEVEARIRREMMDVLPAMGVTNDTYLTTDHVQKLVYLEATIREVLRLYAILPSTRREVVSDTVVCGDIPVRKGDFVLVSIYAMARNPQVWGPDAAQFNPSRWIDSTTGELLTFPPTKFATFNAGPRMCLGMKLAFLELRVVAANLLHRYKFSLVAPNDGSYVMRIALTIKDPLMMTARKIAAPPA